VIRHQAAHTHPFVWIYISISPYLSFNFLQDVASFALVRTVMAATDWVRFLFHAFGLGVVVHSVWWLRQLGLLSPFLLFMFTMWQLVALAAFLTVALLLDARILFSGAGRLPLAYLQLHELLFSFALFFAVTVTSIFWGLFFYDRELIFPRAFVFPALLNHIQHTLPTVLLVIELITFHRRPLTAYHAFTSIPHSRELGLVFASLATYLALTAALYAKAGRWPYPFMSGFSVSTFAVFSIVGVVTALLLSALLRTVRLSAFGRASADKHA
jgi:hypothetical protein